MSNMSPKSNCSKMEPSTPRLVYQEHTDPIEEQEKERPNEETDGLKFTAPLTRYIASKGTNVISIYAAVTSCITYLLVYGFRKPWSIEKFGEADDPKLFGLDTKMWMTICQNIGYVVGKFVGVYFISSLKQSHRFPVLMTLPILNSITWLGFGAFGRSFPWGTALSIFLSCIPIAWSWALLYRYIEGRNNGDFLGAILSCSYIIGSGVAKYVGALIKQMHVNSYWLPFVGALVYLIPFVVFAILTCSTPPPTQLERQNNSQRRGMTGKEQMVFLKKYWPGLLALTIAYMLLTTIRDFRDTFQTEIFSSLISQDELKELFVITEIPVGLSVLLCLCLLNLVKDSRRSILIQHAIFLFGMGLILVSHVLFECGAIGGITWYIGIGMGIFLSYSPIGAMFYDRLMGALNEDGTAVFMISISDTCGYIGSVILVIYKAVMDSRQDSLNKSQTNFKNFFSGIVFVSAFICLITTTFSLLYWWRHLYRGKPKTLFNSN